MDMILTTCGLDVDNMLIFGPYFAHIFSVNLKVRSTADYKTIKFFMRLRTRSLLRNRGEERSHEKITRV